jgi:hypothetical protein
MEEFIDEKIKEVSKRVGPISFDKGTDNYNTMKDILTQVYNAGVGDGLGVDNDWVNGLD